MEVIGLHGNPSQGPFIQLFLTIENNLIVDMKFKTHKCPTIICVCSDLLDLVKGKSIQEALEITPEILLKEVGGLPLGKQRYPKMAVEALKNAIEKL